MSSCEGQKLGFLYAWSSYLREEAGVFQHCLGTGNAEEQLHHHCLSKKTAKQNGEKKGKYWKSFCLLPKGKGKDDEQCYKQKQKLIRIF